MDSVHFREMSSILWILEKCHGHCGFHRNVMDIVDSRKIMGILDSVEMS